MVTYVILDLDTGYLEKYADSVDELAGKYEVIIWNDKDCDMAAYKRENTLIITDSEAKSAKWSAFPVIAVEHARRVYNTPYVTEELPDIDSAYIELAYSRKNNFPVIIYSDEYITMREFVIEDFNDVRRILVKDMYHSRVMPDADGFSDIDGFGTYISGMYDLYGYGLWAVTDSNNTLIGICGIENRTIAGREYHELGYIIDEKFRRQGYGIRACRAAIDYVKEYGMDTIVAYIDNKNTPSKSLICRLGFVYQENIADGDYNYDIYRKDLTLV